MRVGLLLAAMLLAIGSHAGAEVIDRVVAYVDTEAITLSELDEAFEKTKEMSPGAARSEVLGTMINRRLLLREARRLRLEAPDEDRLLEEYIDLKFRAFIKIKESDIEDFFEANPGEFGSSSYDEVKDQIEGYLTEKEVNYRIRRHLDDLKKNAHIKVLIE